MLSTTSRDPENPNSAHHPPTPSPTLTYPRPTTQSNNEGRATPGAHQHSEDKETAAIPPVITPPPTPAGGEHDPHPASSTARRDDRAYQESGKNRGCDLTSQPRFFPLSDNLRNLADWLGLTAIYEHMRPQAIHPPWLAGPPSCCEHTSCPYGACSRKDFDEWT
jgi:hypothetical protein